MPPTTWVHKALAAAVLLFAALTLWFYTHPLPPRSRSTPPKPRG